MAHKTYTSSGKTIDIYSDYESITLYLSGFDAGGTSYNRDFYIEYKRTSQATSRYDYFDRNGAVVVPAYEDPEEIEAYQGGLMQGTSYSVKISVWNNETVTEVWSWENTSAISTDYKVPEPYIDSVDTSRGTADVRIYWDVDEENDDAYYEIQVRQGTSGSYVVKKTVYSVPSSYTSVSVNKYEQNYQVRIVAYYEGDYENSNVKTFKVPLVVPDEWNWTSAEISAFDYHGKTTVLTRTRWNEFIDKANEIIAYYNAKQGKSLDLIPSTSKMGTDKILYAEDFKAVRFYIDKMNPISTSDIPATEDIISGKSVVKGSYFEVLSDTINEMV